MITLKDLVLRQQFSGETDGELIVEWFIENNMVEKGIEMISQMALRKFKEDEHKYGCLIGDLSMYGATESLIKTFGRKDGVMLDNICRRWIISDQLGENFEELYPQHIEWLKEIIPTKNRSFVFWNKFANYLHSLNIYFKDDKKEDK